MENNVTLAGHKVLLKEGQPAEKLYIIRHGRVLCLKASKDRLIPVFLAGPGDIIGEAALLEDISNPYSAITLTHSEMTEIPSETFHEVMKHSPSWLQGLTSTMISRFQSTAQLIAENRVIDAQILNDEVYPDTLEFEFKKLLNQ